MAKENERRQSGLTGLQIQGYKSLRDLTDVAFGCLTILAGANSDGKSSLMQPLLLLKQTFDAPYDPGVLLLDGPNVTFSDVRQIFWRAAGKQRASRFTLKLQMLTQSGEIVLQRVKGQTKSKPESMHILECNWSSGNRVLELRSDMTPGEVRKAASDSELAGLPKNLLRDRATLVRNRAFLVVGLEESFPLPGPWSQFEQLLRSLIHVPGLRGNPRRTYRQTAVEDYFPGIFPDYVASVVARWQQEKADPLQSLGEDLRRLGLTWKVEAHQVSATEVELRVGRLRESRRGGAQDMVSIADVGFGVSQVLPVVVALHAARPGQIVYVEQPEIHLHPRAQVALAEILGRATRRGVQVVVETHSELLLLGVQHLVASGELDPGKVKLHWFERDEEGATLVKTAELDAQGAFGDWPVDFSDVSLEAMRAYLDTVTRQPRRAQG